MVIAPCTINTASSIAYGIADNLIARAADVTLKEKRKLILLVRETPLHEGHLSTLLRLSRLGAIIMPPVPAFYIRPRTIDDIVAHTVSRVLDLLGFEVEFSRWDGLDSIQI
jgi:4-hydroxy-3-polyprenylbenzoate decarboxylase